MRYSEEKTIEIPVSDDKNLALLPVLSQDDLYAPITYQTLEKALKDGHLINLIKDLAEDQSMWQTCSLLEVFPEEDHMIMSIVYQEAIEEEDDGPRILH